MGKKTILRFDESDTDEVFDFALFGIVCHQRPYMLCHELNKKLSLQLKRDKEDYVISTTRRMNLLKYPNFVYTNTHDDQYYLLGNRPLELEGNSKNDLLIPEQHQVNFFLIIKEKFVKLNMDEEVSRIREIDIVLGAYRIDVKILKSREHLLFL